VHNDGSKDDSGKSLFFGSEFGLALERGDSRAEVFS
jgi:hypothetical protein